MKRALKIAGWTIFSLLMTVIIAVVIVCYVLFTPSRLTPLVRQIAGEYITCDYEIGEVELTFFSTFPHLTLRADGLTLIHPMEGAQNDTVLAAKRVTATVNLKELVFNNHLIVREAVLDDARVNCYTAADGTTNYDVFKTDTTQTDTTESKLPFDQLRIEGLRVNATSITYVNEQDSIEASLTNAVLTAQAPDWNHFHIGLEANDVCARMQGETYADNMHVALDLPMDVQLDSMHFTLHDASLALNEFALGLDGDITLGDSIDVNMHLTTGQWDIESLLAILPASLQADLAEYDLRGKIRLDATATGIVSDTEMPVVTLHALDADLWNSRFNISGFISDLDADWLLDIRMDMHLLFPDIKRFILPDEVTLKGIADGLTQAKIRLSDLADMRLEKGLIDANWKLSGLTYKEDEMLIRFPQSTAHIQFPNNRPSRPSVNWTSIDLKADKMDFELDKTTNALLDAPDMHIELANIFNDEQDYFASITMDGLDAKMDTILADLKKSKLEAFISGGKKVDIKLLTDAFSGRMGEDIIGKTRQLGLEVAARYDKKAENLLLQWNPRLKIHMREGHFDLPNYFPEALAIPSMDFKYSNREMTIDSSRIELGNSDLNIHGAIRNIGKWLRKEAVLEGELNIVSDHCDANQLLAWFSADEGSEEEPSEVSNDQSAVSNDADKASDPFLVPTDVDLELHTHMKEVELFTQTASDLKGGIYVKDGSLILDEVGFVCRAAKLQLTAMYRTPRRNHLYLGLDYHMIDVDIDELLTMIPNLEEMVPMLSSFQGSAEFHLAAETYLKSNYEPKMSTLRGAASLTGKDLVVLDSETFDKISKMLLFSKKTENKIDSINAEITLYKNQIDVYPLCVQMDNYMVALGGRHNTNMTFDYDINVLKPIYLGLNISGTLDNLEYKLVKCKFAQDFRPHWYQKVDNQSRELRERIKQSMEKNVRIK